MTPYKNLSGESGIDAYEIGPDSITVSFMYGDFQYYLYNNLRPGTDVVQTMMSLARQGHGLNTYISKTVRTNFFKKW